jgi:hypothetical protein
MPSYANRFYTTILDRFLLVGYFSLIIDGQNASNTIPKSLLLTSSYSLVDFIKPIMSLKASQLIKTANVIAYPIHKNKFSIIQKIQKITRCKFNLNLEDSSIVFNL